MFHDYSIGTNKNAIMLKTTIIIATVQKNWATFLNLRLPAGKFLFILSFF